MIALKFPAAIGIYVGAREVYLAQLKGSFFKPRLVKFGKTGIQAPAGADELANRQAVMQAARRLIQENNISAKKVFAAIPGKDVLVRYFQMPLIPKSEWETAVKFEAKKYIPFKVEELMWDFHVVLPKGKDNKMSVTFVAVKKEVGQRYLAMAEQAGFKLTVLEPASFSLVRLFAASNQLAKTRPTAIVDVDYGMADINIVKDKICYLTRDVSLPQEEGAVFEHLLNEIRMSLDYYEKLFPTEAIGKVLLCGEVELQDWERKLAEELKVTVEKADLARAVNFPRVAPPTNLAVVVGLGLHGLTQAAAEVNLCRAHELKPAIQAKESFKFTAQVRRTLIRAVVVSCLGLVILQLAMQNRINQENKALEAVISLRPKIELPIGSLAYDQMEEVKTGLESKLALFNSVIDQRFFWTNKLSQLPKILAPSIWLTNLYVSERLSENNKITRSLTIKGLAYHQDPVQEVALVTNLVSGLKSDQGFARGFKEIKLETITSVELNQMAMKEFTISCVAQ